MEEAEVIQAIALYNNAGQLVENIQVEAVEQDVYKMHFDQSLPTGMYLIQTITNQKTFSSPIILN